LRECSTLRNVAGSIPVSVVEVFRWRNSSSHTMGLTKSLTENDTRNPYLVGSFGGQKRSLLGADTFVTFLYLQEIWKPEAPRILRPVHYCNVISLHFYPFISFTIVSPDQIPYRYYQYWMLRTLGTVWNEVGVAQFRVLSLQMPRRRRQTAIDATTLAGLRTEKSVQDCSTVNSFTSQFSSQVRTAALSQFWHRTVAGCTQTYQIATLNLP